MKKAWVLFSLCISFLISCRKETYQKFNATAGWEGPAVHLRWDAFNQSDFHNVSIYRSFDPIPDPGFGKTIDKNLLLATYTQREITDHVDSVVIPGTSGTVYYRIVLSYNNRFVVSDLLVITQDGSSVIFPYGAPVAIVPLPEADLVYFIYNSTIVTLNYRKRQVLSSLNFYYSTYPTPTRIVARVYDGKPELFGNTIYQGVVCYDGLSLQQKYSVLNTSTVRDFTVKDDFAFVLMAGYAVKTYDLSTRQSPGQSNSNYMAAMQEGKLFTAGNKLYFKYRMQIPNYSLGVDICKSYLFSFDLVNNLATNKTAVTTPNLNPDTLDYVNYQYIDVSPDGKYLTCDNRGTIFSLDDGTTFSLTTPGSVEYSTDGKYILNRPDDSHLALEIYSLPGCAKVASMQSPNTITGSFFRQDFLDGDTLVSLNLRQRVQAGKTDYYLTTTIKKFR